MVHMGGPGAIDSTIEAVTANANLIVAAPDLYASLEWALDELARRAGDDNDFAPQEYRDARKALRKAICGF